ncbi:MAG: dihydrolipoyl dehydrogenase [Betaproteobacteria bacterium]
MGKTLEVKVPDIGDFKNIPVIEVLVKPGDSVSAEDPLVTLESDKATMDIPAPSAGVVKAVSLKPGDKVSMGSLILTLEEAGAGSAAPAPQTAAPAAPARPAAAPAPAPQSSASHSAVKADIQCEVLVLGAGPGGYTAAFRAADLGQRVVLVERYPTLGGVCLNVGCIPSKALLHMAKVITEAEEAGHAGIRFGKPEIELGKLRAWKDGVIGKLTKGLGGLAKQRKVQVITGRGEFASPHSVRVETAEGVKTVAFQHCIIAAGSSVAKIPGFPYDDPRIIDSTGALKLAQIPKRLLVIGGGIIGLEMATVYDALGSKISVVELMDGLIPGADRDVVRQLAKRIEKRYEKILLKTKVAKIEAQKDGLKVTFETADGKTSTDSFDAALMAVGRRPNGREIKAEAAGVTVNERGFIPVDKQQRTNVPHIHAIGDICGEPMLAHKATYEAKIAAEVIAGHKAFFDARTVPSVAYTDPEIAWMGLTETQAQAQGIEYEKAVFPWAASGRALATGRDEGMTKLLIDKNTRRVIGAAMAGVNAGELIAEAVLALEMGADSHDLGLTIHPHPTLSETLFFAAEMIEGSITDLYVPKKK